MDKLEYERMIQIYKENCKAEREHEKQLKKFYEARGINAEIFNNIIFKIVTTW